VFVNPKATFAVLGFGGEELIKIVLFFDANEKNKIDK